MWRKIVVLLVLSMGTVAVVSCRKCIKDNEPRECVIRITEPADGDSVPWRPFVEGTVTNPDAKVRVVVHPMKIPDRWVQPDVTVDEDSTWKVQIYIGEPGSAHVGEHFEIMAFANPKKKLPEGKVLKKWPKAQCKSQVVEVIRR